MSPRIAPFIACLALLPSLASCSGSGAPEEPPVSEEALAVVNENPGAPTKALAREVDELFTLPGIGETRALVVMHNGRIVAERYAEDYSAATRFVGWSMSKTVTATLIGMLVGEGKLRLDDPPPIDRWQRTGDPRGEITLRHLLQMRSGLRHQEQAEPVYESGEVRMLFLDGRDDMAGWAEAQPLEYEPGTHFQYSTPTALILSDIIGRVLSPHGSADERRSATDAFLKDRLAGPIGAESMVAEYDTSGTMIGGSMIWANARDWARFGELLRRKGSEKGAQIVSRGWVNFMTSPSPISGNYGGQTWLNRKSETASHVLFPDRASPDVFGAVGHLGQYVIVSPSRGLTIVRLGKTDEPQRDELEEELADIVELYPQG